MSFKQWAWACDPIGSTLLVGSTTLMLLALNWAGGAYPWSNPHVSANLAVGIALFIAFCLYGKSHSFGFVNTMLKAKQNGRGEQMVSLLMSFLLADPTSGSQHLLSPSRGTSINNKAAFDIKQSNMCNSWIFYSAVNAVTPQIILNLGFEDNSWDIAIRLLAFKIAVLLTAFAVTWYATKFKDLSKCSPISHLSLYLRTLEYVPCRTCAVFLKTPLH